jgi:hypothetical protein
MTTLQAFIGIAVTCFFVGLIFRKYLRVRAKNVNQGKMLFAHVMGLFECPVVQRGSTVGVWTLAGQYRGQVFQLKTVVDTLATRKLPSLWFMVTLPEPQPVAGTTDLMMRAAGVSTFSNFDFLPHTYSLPAGFPEQATIRGDVVDGDSLISPMRPHLEFFQHSRGKELLIAPKGLRIVVQLAEADKARYGVLREANFVDAIIDMDLARQMMDTLIDLRNNIREHATK